MTGESVLFACDAQGAPAEAALLFAPQRVLAVQSSSGAITYAPGSDYTIQPGSHRIIAPAGTTLPVKTRAELTPPLGSQPYSLIRRDGAGDILFGAGHEYHDMQALVTYTHAPGEWRGPCPQRAGDLLPVTLRRLESHAPVRIALLGDSISTGCNGSKWAGTPPYQPFYAELLAGNIQAVYGSPVTLENFAVGGMDSAWGAQNTAPVIAARPDLAILAFGMNDSTGNCPTGRYIANLRAQIDAIQGALPACDIILVASMLSNPDWHIARPDLLIEYRAAMDALLTPGVALADVTSVWAEMMARKKHLDVTGNGVNHPNDFGHRVYADVLTALLV